MIQFFSTPELTSASESCTWSADSLHGGWRGDRKMQVLLVLFVKRKFSPLVQGGTWGSVKGGEQGARHHV